MGGPQVAVCAGAVRRWAVRTLAAPKPFRDPKMPGQHRIPRKSHTVPYAPPPPRPFTPAWAADPSLLPKTPPTRTRRP